MKGRVEPYVEVGIANSGTVASLAALLQPRYERERWTWTQGRALRGATPTAAQIAEAIRDLMRELALNPVGYVTTGGLQVRMVAGEIHLYVARSLAE